MQPPPATSSRRTRSWLKWVPVVLALVPIVLISVFLGGLFAVHGAFNMCTSRALAAESPSWSSRWSWLPPGVECTYEHEDGQVRTDLVPWTTS
jgi:hypothetical protein